MKFCSDYFKPEKEGYLPSICCQSCHEDVEYDFPLGPAPDDEDSEVCCAVRIALNTRKSGEER